MTIRFYRRGRLVEVEDIKGTRVIHRPRNEQYKWTPSDPIEEMSSNIEDERHLPTTLSVSGFRPLAQDGWKLAPLLRPEIISERPGAARGPLKEGRLFREDGAIKILTREMIVKLHPSLDRYECARLIVEFGLRKIRILSFAPNLFQTQVIASTGTDELSVELTNRFDDAVIYAEPVIVEAGAPRMATEPVRILENQWQWRNVSAAEAWADTKGDGVRVAVIDRGFHHDAPGLTTNVSRTLSGSFTPRGEFSRDLRRMRKATHGTFCAAQVAASPKDGHKLSGIAPGAEVMLISVTSIRTLTQLEIARAIAYAADPRTMFSDERSRGADVLTCSIGLGSRKPKLESVLEDAIGFARKCGRSGYGLPLFYAVANAAVPISDDELLSHPDIVAVGSSTRNDCVARNCAYGPELDFLAPGVGVFNLYSHLPLHETGTSFATPIAAGIGALALSIAPHLRSSDLRHIMRKSCRSPGAACNSEPESVRYGHGIVDAAATIREVKTWIRGPLLSKVDKAS